MNIFLIFAFLVSLSYRIYGLWHNHPFWVDEFSSAQQAKLILQHGLNVFTDKSLIFDAHNITTHFLIALSFKLFGINEFAARLPNVILGSLIPIAVFFVAKKLLGKTAAVSALVLSTFSYFEITWSRQARSYILLQLLILATFYFYFSLLEKKRNASYYVGFSVCLILGILTHLLYYLFILAIIIHAVIFYRNFIRLKKLLHFIIFFTAIVLFFSATRIFDYFRTNFAITNNVWYYHSFLWREYGLISFLGFIGLVAGFLKYSKKMTLVFFHIILHLIFILFFFPPYVSRYLLPVFPYLLIGMSYSIVQIGEILNSDLKSLAPHRFKKLTNPLLISLAITLVILANGYKFVNKPKQFYSVNHDFREIALVDYNKIYDVIKTKGRLNEGKTAVVDTWDARLYWYVGRDYPGRYVFRWENEIGSVNGLVKRTDYIFNKEGEKIIPADPGERFIGKLKDLKRAITKYRRGFIIIDDATLPEDVRDYAEKNFKKELYLDHYPLDDNPYSIWPVTLYSWGI